MKEKAHGIMYHHFHDYYKHIVEQGSISAERFDDMLDYYGRTHNIITAEEFLHKSLRDILHKDDVCLTFDDGLLCQYDIAYPVMKDRKLTAFWFIYTSPLDGILEKLEIYRHFRFSKFENIEDFYSAFFEILDRTDKVSSDALQTYNPDEHLKDCPFYTPNDKRFRYIRDIILGELKYNEIMDSMLTEYGYNVHENKELLWINSEQIKDLHNNGHIIGLHSYSHPTTMNMKTLDEQQKEYETNKKQLEQITGSKVVSVSYPCNSYNEDTLTCMQNLGIQIGFRANMVEICMKNSSHEYPREDHANIMKAMEGRR